jgi:hypothetical protein
VATRSKPGTSATARTKAGASKAPSRKLVQTRAPSVQPAAKKAAKPVRPKLVRDSFTIPKAEYAALALLKQRAVKLERPAKKSEILRAGIKALAAMTEEAFVAALDAVPAIKTGRPKSAEPVRDEVKATADVKTKRGKKSI